MIPSLSCQNFIKKKELQISRSGEEQGQASETSFAVDTVGRALEREASFGRRSGGPGQRENQCSVDTPVKLFGAQRTPRTRIRRTQSSRLCGFCSEVSLKNPRMSCRGAAAGPSRLIGEYFRVILDLKKSQCGFLRVRTRSRHKRS